MLKKHALKWLIASIGMLSSLTTQAGALYAINDSTDTLVQIDRSTYAVTTIGALGINGDFGDLTWASTTNTLYAVGGRGNNALYKVDMITGAATLVGNHGVDDMFSLAFDSSTGTLYAQAGNGGFYTLSTATGAATLVGTNRAYPGGMAYNSAADMLLLLEAGSGRVNSINRSTGAASQLATPGSANDNGFTHDDQLGGYWAADWNQRLYRYDEAFNQTNVAALDGSYAAIAYVGDVNGVPEPGTLALVGAALVSVSVLRRRKV